MRAEPHVGFYTTSRDVTFSSVSIQGLSRAISRSIPRRVWSSTFRSTNSHDDPSSPAGTVPNGLHNAAERP